MEDVFNIVNLHPNVFLNPDGKTVWFAPTVKLSERPEDLKCDVDSLD